MAPPPAGARVSVVVPVGDAAGDLPRLLEALRAQTLPASSIDLVFVDNGSSDGSAEWLAANLPPNARLLFCPKERGAYAARNVGVAAAGGDVVAFTDTDCRPEPQWLVEGLRALGSSCRAAGLIVVQKRPLPTIAEELDAARFLRQERYVVEAFGATANLFVHRFVFETVGLFDERLVSGGDQELGARAEQAGFPIELARRAVVHHPARKSLGMLLAKAHRVGVGFGQCLRAHSPEHAAACLRIQDRLSLIAHSSANGDATTGRRLALMAGQALLAASTALGCAKGYAFGRNHVEHPMPTLVPRLSVTLAAATQRAVAT